MTVYDLDTGRLEVQQRLHRKSATPIVKANGNGTDVMALHDLEKLLKGADDRRVHESFPHPGGIAIQESDHLVPGIPLGDQDVPKLLRLLTSAQNQQSLTESG